MTNISIIVTAYNEEKSIGRCLKSIMAQENADMQMECVIVDDASVDGTLEQMKTAVHSYSGNIHFRMLRHKNHRGPSATRNTGLQQAQGDYVMFVNASDQLMPGCMDVYTENLMRYWDTEVIVGNVFNVQKNQGLIQNLSSPMVLRGDSSLICDEMILRHLYLYPWNRLIRRDLLMNYHVFFNDSLAYGDVLWSFQLFSHVTSMVLLPSVTYSCENRAPLSIGAAEKRANDLLGSFSVTCDEMLDHSPRPQSSSGDYYLHYQLFVYGMLMAAKDIQSEYAINSQIKRELSRVKSKLVSQTRNDGHKVLSSYFMMSTSPFGGIVKLPAYRHYAERVDEIAEMLRQVL